MFTISQFSTSTTRLIPYMVNTRQNITRKRNIMVEQNKTNFYGVE